MFFYVVVCFSNPGRGWDPGGTGFDSHSPVVEEEEETMRAQMETGTESWSVAFGGKLLSTQ